MTNFISHVSINDLTINVSIDSYPCMPASRYTGVSLVKAGIELTTTLHNGGSFSCKIS